MLFSGCNWDKALKKANCPPEAHVNLDKMGKMTLEKLKMLSSITR
jgi:hypothetical protein